MNRILCVAASVFGIAFLPANLSAAAVVGTDNAAQSPYSNGWQTSDDGAATGDGFNAWALTAGSGGFLIESAGVLGGSSTGAINSSGVSFGLFSNNTEANAIRTFNGGDLAVGQSFSIDLAVNFRGGFKGIDLRNSGGGTLINFNVGDVGSGDDYTIQNAATGNGSIGNTYSSNTNFHLVFSQTSLGGGTLQITRSGGVSDFDTATYSGVAAGFKLYIGNAGGGASDNLYANNLSVVPEPSTFALAALGSFGLVLLRRRRG